MYEHGFSDEEVRDSETFLKALNAFYSNVEVGLQMPLSGISVEDRVHLARFHQTPFLVKKPKAGGRFHHPGSSYQRIASSLRHLLTINGGRTSEVDITAATLQFLGIVLEKELLNPVVSDMFSQGDPYQYFLEGIDGELGSVGEVSREDVKTLVYTTVYSDKKKQKGNLAHKLRMLGIPIKHFSFVNLFSDFFDALAELKEKLDVPPHMAIFKEEARYAQKVLEIGCLEKHIPIIPIHDSFIVRRRNRSKLTDLLDFVAEGFYGKKLTYKIKY
jgi:hypothetical protein